MANKVLTIFEGDAKQLFGVADKVEARLKGFEKISLTTASSPSPAVAAQAVSPVIQAQKTATQAVATESAKREQIEEAASKKSQDLVKQELATHVDFFNSRQKILERHAADEVKMQETVAAAAAKRAVIDRIEVDKRIQANVLGELALIKARRATLGQTAAIETEETTLIVRESVKRAEARRASLLSEGSAFRGAARGAGLGSFLTGGTLAAAGAFAVVATEVSAIKAYNEEVTSSSQRTARLTAASSDLNIAQKDLSKSVDDTAIALRTTKAEAVDIIVPIAELASKTRQPLADLKDAVIDLASARGVDKASLPNLLDDIAQGTANTALLGQNASAILEIYAAKIGKTVEQLSEAEKRQALVNRLLSEGALNAGANANALDKDAVSLNALDNAWSKFLVTLAGASAAKAGIDALTKSLGGEPEFGRFDPSRAFNTPGFGNAARADAIGIGRFTISQGLRDQLAPEKIFAPDIEAADAEVKKRHAEYRRLFDENRQALLDAAKSPTANIVNAALAKLNFDQLKAAFPNPEDLRKFLDKQITDFKSVQEARARAIETGLSQGAGNLTELRRLRQVIPSQIVDPAETRRLSDVASKAISDTFKDAIDSAKTNVPKLRDLYRQIAIAPDVATLDKNGLLRSVNDQITQVVDAQKAKVKELATAAKSAFDAVAGREGSRNPFLQFLTEADKRMESLIKNTEGFSKAFRGALVQREQFQNNLDLLNLRFNARNQAFNLSDEANSFKRFNTFGSTDSLQVQSIKGFIAAQGEMTGFWKDFWDRQLKDAQKQDFQDRLDKQIGIARNAFLSGPAGNSPEARSLFNQEVIKLTPLSQVDQFSTKEISEAIASRQEEAQHQLEFEKAAQAEREKQSQSLVQLAGDVRSLMELANKGGLPVNLGNQAISVVEVTTPNLSVSKRSSTNTGPKKSTADAMQP
jgi:hypothetical protein